MLNEIIEPKFEGYEFLGHVLIVDPQDSNMHFEEFKSGPDARAKKGLSRSALEFLARNVYAQTGATHVHVGDSRRVCIEGARKSMENYTVYTVAYFKKAVHESGWAESGWV